MNILDRIAHEKQEAALLAPYACKSALSSGRDVPEQPDSLRTEFQRDRDRILHSQAFRKLEYKTQVYVTHEGDYFRTRLTHTLEVAQVARTLARSLGLNQDLTEAIALAHDLGHTPFGHTGEAVLNELLADEGGFEHNAQSLRVVELLEDRFQDRPGLNLTWEVREGIAHHSSAVNLPSVRRYLTDGAPSLEAQIADLADEIAYNHHDLDDALGMGLLAPDQLRAVPWVWDLWMQQVQRWPGIDAIHLKYRMLGTLIELLIQDALKASAGELEKERIDSPQAAKNTRRRLIGFSPEARAHQTELRQFLIAEVYRNPATLAMQAKSARFLHSLFELYVKNSDLLPRSWQAKVESWGLKRVLTDYLSGMTDRHCLEDYLRHFEPTLRWTRPI